MDLKSTTHLDHYDFRFLIVPENRSPFHSQKGVFEIQKDVSASFSFPLPTVDPLPRKDVDMEPMELPIPDEGWYFLEELVP